jgi:hypothetical protein
MKGAWDLKKKKWLYWVAVAGFLLSLSFLLWLVAVVLYFVFDKGKPRTKNYKVNRIFEKYMIVVGIIGLVWFGIKIVLYSAGINPLFF